MPVKRRNQGSGGVPEWNALTDSVKQGLAELPTLKGQALSARMRAHAERVKRLIRMHEKMMGNSCLHDDRARHYGGV